MRRLTTPLGDRGYQVDDVAWYPSDEYTIRADTGLNNTLSWGVIINGTLSWGVMLLCQK